MRSARIAPRLRGLVKSRARGLCEYCLLPWEAAFFPHEPDHVIARKHGGATTADNLALACFDCNRFKGSDIASVDPQSGRIVPLFNPRSHDWSEHFKIRQGKIAGITPEGRATERLLRFNLLERIEVRQILVASGQFRMPAEK